MTTLEITLSLIIWIGYGFYSSFIKTVEGECSQEEITGLRFFMTLFGPLTFILRALYGAFIHTYKMK